MRVVERRRFREEKSQQRPDFFWEVTFQSSTLWETTVGVATTFARSKATDSNAGRGNGVARHRAGAVRVCLKAVNQLVGDLVSHKSGASFLSRVILYKNTPGA